MLCRQYAIEIEKEDKFWVTERGAPTTTRFESSGRALSRVMAGEARRQAGFHIAGLSPLLL